MRHLDVAWLPIDKIENIEKYGIGFTEAKEVVLNDLSIQIINLQGDYAYIGLSDDMTKVLYVYCSREGDMRRIIFARKANTREANTFFLLLAKGK